MTRPSRVVVLGQTMTIEWHGKAGPLDTDTRSGRNDVHAQRIDLRSDDGPDQMRDTLLHEVMHSCLRVVGSDGEEAIVGLLAPVLLDVLRSNPDVTAFLLDGSAAA